ncbi:MAG: hypothetical protein WCZ20_04570 [Hydrogenophaga sp.]|jgi:hypothetical protein|uniref:hypothetical protein n=1 Tax=Hydrogenophaga sp. TaxID=1904254 RepID=UPI000EE9503D|nr:hypothetical protein [Hydrogenophaga sp.]MDD3785432.1 hypothetical protein [Hydrogenophaga sp.]MDX9968247.1 hypothetical protein [Hydrogenophaga sp.]HAJ12664.1 hypothetical protein [Comamonadaceae bacterium]
MSQSSHYRVRLHTPDGGSASTRQQAERAFARALDASLGDPAMVLPVYHAVQRIRVMHGDPPDSEALGNDERMLYEHWLQAESAALEAVWGPHRHLDEGGYEILPPGPAQG